LTIEQTKEVIIKLTKKLISNMRIDMRFMQKETPLNEQEMKDYLKQQLIGFSP